MKQVREFLKFSASPGVKNRVTATGLGWAITQSPNFVPRLFKGHDVNTETYDKTIAFITKWYEDNGYYSYEEDKEEGDYA